MSQDLLSQTTREKNINVPVISEPYRNHVGSIWVKTQLAKQCYGFAKKSLLRNIRPQSESEKNPHTLVKTSPTCRYKQILSILILGDLQAICMDVKGKSDPRKALTEDGSIGGTFSMTLESGIFLDGSVREIVTQITRCATGASDGTVPRNRLLLQ